MTYREYLKNLIIENVEDYDAQEVLMESVDCAEDAGDLDSLEEYLTSVFEDANADNLTLKERHDMGGASTASDNGRKNNNEYEIPWFDGLEKHIKKGIEQISHGDINDGSITITITAKKGIEKFDNELKKFSKEDRDIIKSLIDELEEQSKALLDNSKSGKITASDAKTKANKIYVKIKLIAKKIKSAASKITKTTESVLDAMIEGASDGYLSDSDLAFLTESLDLS